MSNDGINNDNVAQENNVQDKEKNLGGRPESYSREIADKILNLIAAGESVRKICREHPEFPSRQTINTWIINDIDGFSDRYARAKELCAEEIAEETFEIADDATNDYMQKQIEMDGASEHPGYIINGEHIQRSRLRIDTRKWYLSKVAPKRYGDKINLNHGVEEGNPLEAFLQQISGSSLQPSQNERASDSEDE